MDSLNVMATPIRVPGRSDPTLVSAVQTEVSALSDTAAAKGAPLPVKPVSLAAGVNAGITVRPIDAMLRLAKATRPLITDDVYDWYQHWSWLRYLGIFSAKTGELRLSAAGLKVRANQRRVMSEELGVGFGALVAERWCQRLGAAGPINLVDVDLALTEGRRWIAVHGGNITVGRRQPDYLLIYPDPASSRSFVFKALECKGTTSLANVTGQLARATTQLASLKLSGMTPQGIAVDIVSNDKGVSYFAVDPEEGEVDDQVLVTDDVLQQARQMRYVERTPEGAVDVPAADFVATSLLMAMGTLADYAGNGSAAATYLPQPTLRRLDRAQRSRVVNETADGRFVGLEYALPTPDGPQLTVFLGVAQDVDAALTTGQLDEVNAAQAAFRDRRLDREQELMGQGNSDGIGVASSTSDDGAILILSRRG